MTFEPGKKYDRPIIKRNQPNDTYKAQPLPAPSGAYPYRIDVEQFIPMQRDTLSFHMAGDTGGMHNPVGQQQIAGLMARQITGADTTHRPAFLYHLGDVVYHFGEAQYYEKQFFTPYRSYPAPIFAIAGNHDSDVNPANPVPYHSLEAFMAVFCDTEIRDISFITNTQRKSMVQPNVYWTLQTPLATIIGLHSNVPKYGYIAEDQRKWFVEELKAADKLRLDKAIIVCIHHAPYSADVNHGSSLPMVAMLESAFTESGVLPDVVFSGHVHNYQRFNKTYANGKKVPFIVCGAGGFDELHSLASIDDPSYQADNPILANVSLENYCDDKHGFLKINLNRTANRITLSGEYFVVGNSNGNAVAESRDTFSYIL